MNQGLIRGVGPGVLKGLRKIEKGNFGGLHKMSAETAYGIDPLLIGQPTLYISPRQDYFTVVTPPPVIGSVLTVINNYQDNAIAWTAASATNRATVQSSGFAERSNPLSEWSFGWVGNTTSQGRYTGGTTSTFRFLHDVGYAWTLYWINKPNKNESTGTSKILLGTSNSTGSRGLLVIIIDSGGLRVPTISIRNATGGVNVLQDSWNTYDSTKNNDRILYSCRVFDPGATGLVSAYFYENGDLIKTATQVNAPSSGVSATVMNIGNRGLADLRYDGLVGDVLLYNGMHGEITHQKICNYLMEKWGIWKTR